MEGYPNLICACMADMSFKISRRYGNAVIQVAAQSNNESVLAIRGESKVKKGSSEQQK